MAALVRKGQNPLGNNKRLLFLRGLFGTIALYGFFQCFQNLPLSVAILIANLTPLTTVAISQFYLGERASLLQWLLLLLSFVGVVLAKGNLESASTFWMLIGVGSSVFASMAIICVRKLKSSEDPLVVVFYFSVISVLSILPLAVHQWRAPSSFDLFVLALIGLATQGGQYFATKAYQLESVSNLMIFNYSGIFLAAVIGYIFFQESLTVSQCLGLSLVFLCLCANYFSRPR